MGKEFIESDKLVRKITVDVTNYIKKTAKIDWKNQNNVRVEI